MVKVTNFIKITSFYIALYIGDYSLYFHGSVLAADLTDIVQNIEMYAYLCIVSHYRDIGKPDLLPATYLFLRR